MVNVYRLPALLPLAATPPGNGRITPGTAAAAAAARVAASRAASAVAPKNHRFPPISPSANPHRRSTTNSPLRIGTTQHRRPCRSAVYWCPSPKYATFRPIGSHFPPGFGGNLLAYQLPSAGSTLNAAVVGHGIT